MPLMKPVKHGKNTAPYNSAHKKTSHDVRFFYGRLSLVNLDTKDGYQD